MTITYANYDYNAMSVMYIKVGLSSSKKTSFICFNESQLK